MSELIQMAAEAGLYFLLGLLLGALVAFPALWAITRKIK